MYPRGNNYFRGNRGYHHGFDQGYQGFDQQHHIQPQQQNNFQQPRGARNRRRGGRPGAGPQVHFRAPARAEQENRSGPPAPQHLSRVESVEKNDPLYKEAVFVEASQDLRPNSDNLDYFVGCEGFFELSLQIYDELRATSPGFARRVTLAAFRYYCAVLTWQRMLKLHAKNGYRTSFDEQDFVRLIDDGGFEMPSPLAIYLNGMGNTTMPSGRDVLFRLKERTYVESEQELIGWFGQVTDLNHYIYRNYPCLAVFARSIMQCLRLTADPNQEEHRNWDLPQDIVPAEENHGLPSINMMGYAPAEVYSAEQIRFLAGVGFTVDVYPPSDSETMVVFTGLMRTIQAEINVTNVFRLDPVSSVLIGSQAENLLVTIPQERRVPAATGRAIPKCLSKLTSVVAYIGAGLKYRTLHEDERRRRNAIMTSCVYTFNNFEQVPLPWAETNNNMREGEDPNYNQNEFSSVEFLVRSRIEKLISSERVSRVK